MMVTYGLYEGIACQDDIAVAVKYTFQQYKELYGKDVESYKDFLLTQEKCLEEISKRVPVRVFRIPFDKKLYENWLAVNGEWANSCYAHLAWALYVVKNHALYRKLDKINITLPPFDERFSTAWFCLLFSFLIFDEQSLLAMVEKNLPENILKYLNARMRETLNKCLPFKKKSALRCEGITVILGNKLAVITGEKETTIKDVMGDIDEKVRMSFINGADFRLRTVNVSSKYSAPVLKSFRLEKKQGLAIILFLPVILVGSATEIEYARKSWISGGISEKFNEAITAKAKEMIGTLTLDAEILGNVRLASWDTAPFVANEMMLEAADILQNEGIKKKGGHLFRVK